MATPTRPLVTPDAFTGENSWTEWFFHFQNVSEINGWNEDDKLKWLKVRLIGRAQTAFQRLPVAVQAKFTDAVGALKERFEPKSQKTRYQAELQCRRKKKTESWPDLAEDLRLLADKAYPDLGDKARETLALNAYLAQLDNPQVAFGVKQKTPADLDAAVSATLELESYLNPKALTATVEIDQTEPTHPVGAVSNSRSSMTDQALTTLVEKLIDRVEKLEASTVESQKEWTASTPGRPRRGASSRRDQIVCWNCGNRGHIARFCHAPRKMDQGNY